MKPNLPTNCREHANGRVTEVQRHLADGNVAFEVATFLCGCHASLTRCTTADGSWRWSLDETIFWKEGQA